MYTHKLDHGNELVILNPSDRDWTRHRYILWFGAYASTHVMVWANSLDDALEIAVNDYLVDHAPGLLADEAVQEEYDRLVSEGMSEEEAQEEAEIDTTCCSSSGLHYVNSWEWGITAEDPTRADVLALMGRAVKAKRAA